MRKDKQAVTATRKRSSPSEAGPSVAAPPGISASRSPAPAGKGSAQKPHQARSFPIVGIGASAGGLEAFSELLQHLPTETGMAFVLVQHLDPTHESILSGLLSRTTTLPVREAQNGMPLEPDHVYVIPPNAKMTVADGVLKLVKERREKGAHHSIDYFLESLARECGPQAIGVILSGSASDGTRGVEAIKSEGGITFAQDRSAKYESMPQSAIASGCVDFILPPARIAEELGKIAHHPHLALGKAPGEPPASSQPASPRNDYVKVMQLLRVRTGVDFSLYKTATIQRRISRRMALRKATRLGVYLKHLREHPEEVDALYQDLLINVTQFFRNPESFEALKQKVFPELLKGRTPDQTVRVWVLGCSTGQEAYSIAMVFMEFASQAGIQVGLQIFASDLNEALLEKARVGLYSKNQVQEVSPARLRRFFVEEEGGYRICKPIRELCVFAKHNALSDPPFSRIDLLSCRNVMIYLEPAPQKRLLPIFHYALKPGGFLLLGNSETIGGFAELFTVVDKAHKLYSRKAISGHPKGTIHRHQAGPAQSAKAVQGFRPMGDIQPGEADAQKEADRILLAKYAPAGVLVNEAFNILQFRGHLDPYLELPAGRATYNLLKMVREGLLMPVRTALQKARNQQEPVRLENLEFRFGGQKRVANLEVVPVRNLKERWFLALFEQAPAAVSARRAEPPPRPEPPLPRDLEEALRENTRLRNELTTVREYLQSITEQYEAANEELQAANEEAQSSNEELQSINEELETTKEELQSTNEELTTVNEEMGTRNVELHRINSDLNNVLTGVQMCIVVLASDLSVRRFTPLAEKVLNLVPTDVGRPITNIRPNFEFPDFENVITSVINTMRPHESEVQDKEGRWYSLRILPYKTLDNRIDGAVLALVDINALKQSEQRVKAALDYAESMIETVREPLLVLNGRLQIERANRSFYVLFRCSPADIEGQLLYQIAGGRWNLPRLRSLLQEVLSQNRSFNDFEVEADFDTLGHRAMLLNGRPIASEGGQPQRILLAIEDVTERRQLEVVRQSEQRFRTLAEALPHLVWISLPDGNCDYFNSKWTEYTGLPPEALLGMQWREKTVHPVDAQRTYDLWCAALKGQVPYNLEFRVRRADGEYHWFLARATPLRDHAGKITKWFGTCTDIEEQKQAKQELEMRVDERTARLRDLVQELEAFSYSVSHDLRSPLRAMIGFAHLAAQEAGDKATPRLKDYLERIVAGANRADRLIQDVLTYSRVSRANINLAPIDLEKLINEVIAQYPDFQPPKAEVQVRSPLIRVMGHEASLVQCVSNLLANATKFVPPGAIPQVRIWTQPLDGQVRVWFEDNGIGIAPANLDRIFSMFERVHSRQEYEGTGIGLAIVRRNVERMGGAAGVESEFGKGSRFWIQLKGAYEQTDSPGGG